MDGMVLKVERAREDSAFGNPLDAKVQAADDFITCPPLCAVHDSSKSTSQHYMREELMRSNRPGFYRYAFFANRPINLQPHLSFRDLRSCRGDVLSIHIVSGVKLWAALM